MRLCLFFTLLTAAAVAQVSAPAAGFVRDSAGCLRAVLGVSGSFVLGEAIERGVISAGFGKTAGFAKTESELLVVRAGEIAERLAAPAGPSLFYLGRNGEIEQVYFPSTRDLWRVERSGFKKTVDADAPEEHFEIRGDEVILQNGTRIKIPEPCTRIEWSSDKSLVVRGARALYTVRPEDASVMQLPQAAQ
jgi:hypothetical protein